MTDWQRLHVRSTNLQCHFQARDKPVFNPVAYAPVAASAYARLAIPQMAFAERGDGLGVAPAVYHGMLRLGAYAGYFGKGFQELDLDALGIVFKVAP